jgi:hypothetical protein
MMRKMGRREFGRFSPQGGLLAVSATAVFSKAPEFLQRNPVEPLVIASPNGLVSATNPVPRVLSSACLIEGKPQES